MCITLVGTDPHPIETRQSILVSGHKSCASLIAKIVGLFATIAPSCQRFTSEKKKSNKKNEDRGAYCILKTRNKQRHS
jgi:hypothetical protein